ncbi:7TM diverse intracellular signaling domain-containing protein [Hymenobacter pini]|uniref:7TM diverse intracellular signaling domain-containing protein n=1 Tax=Hymenobacter pini TaxID=2880879 RepID=UPI001CF35A4D|nr:7TM diverse intracellular signaling domain-containing protein [Hymenobacter pini]MCA8829705.1 hypothetical protein [Hymenobacter pini]
MPLRLYLLLLLLATGPLRARAQSGPDKTAGQAVTVAAVEALPAQGHAWSQIRTDRTLPFRTIDSLPLARARRYWLRVQLRNPSSYAQAGRLIVLPNLDNTLHYVDEDTRRWRTHRAGVAVATDRQPVKGPLPLRVPGRTITTVYVLLRLSPTALLPTAAHLQVSWQPEAVVQADALFYTTAWAVAVAVLLLLLTNLPAYLRYRDRTVLFYVCTQMGALLYVTGYRNYFRVWFPRPLFNQFLLPDGLGYGYTLNNVIVHLSVVLMLAGFVQLTRAYLSTRAHLPRLDTALRFALRSYCLFTLVVGTVNLLGFPLNRYTLRLDNLLVLLLVGLLLGMAVVAYRRKVPLASAYLLANALPMLCVGATAAFHAYEGIDNTGRLLLPDLAILSYALCFSVALNVRLQLLQRTLRAKEREADYLALDIQRQELRHREIVLKNSHIQAALLELRRRQQTHDEHARQLSQEHQQQQATNLELQQQLEANQRELASATLYMQQKNALLSELKQQIQDLHRQSPADKRPELAGIQLVLQSSQHLDEDWSRFKLHFEQVHPRFFEELQARYPTLTAHELRLSSYFHIQLSTKEIAVLLNIDPASVRRAKTRLYKKMAAADHAAGRSTGPRPTE